MRRRSWVGGREIVQTMMRCYMLGTVDTHPSIHRLLIIYV